MTQDWYDKLTPEEKAEVDLGIDDIFGPEKDWSPGRLAAYNKRKEERENAPLPEYRTVKCIECGTELRTRCDGDDNLCEDCYNFQTWMEGYGDDKNNRGN